MKFRRTAAVAAIALASLASACDASDVLNLPRATQNAKCTKVGAFARNSTKVLQCKPNRRWTLVMGIDAAMTFIEQYNQTHVGAVSPVTMPISVSSDAVAPVTLSARVTNKVSQIMAGQTVTFSQFTGAGSITSAATVVTGPDGIASVTFTPSNHVGTAGVVASVGGDVPSAGFSIVTTAGAPTAITSLTPTTVSITADGSGLTPIYLRVTDAAGNPVPGAPIAAIDVDDTLIVLYPADDAAKNGVTNANGVFATFATGLGYTDTDFIDFYITLADGTQTFAHVVCNVV